MWRVWLSTFENHRFGMVQLLPTGEPICLSLKWVGQTEFLAPSFCSWTCFPFICRKACVLHLSSGKRCILSFQPTAVLVAAAGLAVAAGTVECMGTATEDFLPSVKPMASGTTCVGQALYQQSSTEPSPKTWEVFLVLWYLEVLPYLLTLPIMSCYIIKYEAESWRRTSCCFTVRVYDYFAFFGQHLLKLICL